MEEASCERGVFVSDYLSNSDEFSVIQGPAARIRPSRLPENFFSCEFSCTQRSLAHRVLFVTTDLCFSPQSTTKAWWTSCRYANYPTWEFRISKRNEGWASRFAPSVHDSRLLCVCLCVFWSAGPLTSQWRPTWRKTFPKGCTLPTTTALREDTCTWRVGGRLRCESLHPQTFGQNGEKRKTLCLEKFIKPI